MKRRLGTDVPVETPVVPFLFCVRPDLPASDPGDLWSKPKLPRDAHSESFVCSFQPGLLPVRLPCPGTEGEAEPSPREVGAG